MVSSREESEESMEGVVATAGAVAVSDGRTVPSRVYSALTLLLESQGYAEDLGASVWDFAVEADTLRALGLINSDFRWLAGKRLVEHAREITMPGDEQRTFRKSSHLTLCEETCFVLTDKGLDLARTISEQILPLAPSRAVDGAPNQRDRVDALNGKLAPIWDRDRQELRFGDQVVKQFKVPAANQETILAAFEEEGWPTRIDDPLPPQQDQDPKRRLHDTINSLNRNQKQPLLRFCGDGSGRGIRWEPVKGLNS